MKLDCPHHWVTENLIPIVEKQLEFLGFEKLEISALEGSKSYRKGNSVCYVLSTFSTEWRRHLIDTIEEICNHTHLSPIMWFLHYNLEYIIKSRDLLSLSLRLPEGFPLPAEEVNV